MKHKTAFRLFQGTENKWFATVVSRVPGTVQYTTSGHLTPSGAIDEMTTKVRDDCAYLLRRTNEWLSELNAIPIPHDSKITEGTN